MVKDSDSKYTTGRSWRKSHPFFNDLPFYSNVPRADCMAELLEEYLGKGGYESLLLVSIYFFYSDIPSNDDNRHLGKV